MRGLRPTRAISASSALKHFSMSSLVIFPLSATVRREWIPLRSRDQAPDGDDHGRWRPRMARPTRLIQILLLTSWLVFPDGAALRQCRSGWMVRVCRPARLIACHYSVRRAAIGSRREARHAGIRQAAPATDNRTAITVTNTAGSSGAVPYN